MGKTTTVRCTCDFCGGTDSERGKLHVFYGEDQVSTVQDGHSLTIQARPEVYVCGDCSSKVTAIKLAEKLKPQTKSQ